VSFLVLKSKKLDKLLVATKQAKVTGLLIRLPLNFKIFVMKILRISLLSFVCAALVVMASSFSAKMFTTTEYQFNQTFTLGTDNSDPLVDVAQWDVTGALSGCSANQVKVCGFIVTNEPGETMPSEQVIINHIRAQYEANTNSLSNNEVVEIFVSSEKVAEAIIKVKL
jgi:hypothetical protein